MTLGINSIEKFAYSGQNLLLGKQIHKTSNLDGNNGWSAEKSPYASYSGTMHYIEQIHQHPDTGKRELANFLKEDSYRIDNSQRDNLDTLMSIGVKHVFPESYSGKNSLPDSILTKYMTKMIFWGYRPEKPLDKVRTAFLSSEGAAHVYPCVVSDAVKLHSFVDESIQDHSQEIDDEYSDKYLRGDQSKCKIPEFPEFQELWELPQAPEPPKALDWDKLKTLSSNEISEQLASSKKEMEDWDKKFESYKEACSKIWAAEDKNRDEKMSEYKKQISEYEKNKNKDKKIRDKAVMENRDESGFLHVAGFILDPKHKNDDFAVVNGANHTKNLLRKFRDRIPTLKIEVHKVREDDLD